MSHPSVNGNDYLALPRAPETWIVENLIPQGGLFNLYGAPKAGKSWLALQLAVAISTNEPTFMSLPIRTHGKVLYIQLDTPRSLWAKRLESICEMGLDISNINFADNEITPYPFDILRPERLTTPEGMLTHFPCQDYLKGEINRVQPVLTIIDTLRELHSGDENDSAQMTNAFSALTSSIRPSALCLLSHSRKDNMAVPEIDRENLLQDNRGSSYVAGRMDGIMRASKKRLAFQSRTVELHYLKCHQIEPGMWVIDGEDEEAQIRIVINDATLTTITAKAEALANITHKTVESCRSLIRRRRDLVIED